MPEKEIKKIGTLKMPKDKNTIQIVSEDFVEVLKGSSVEIQKEVYKLLDELVGKKDINNRTKGGDLSGDVRKFMKDVSDMAGRIDGEKIENERELLQEIYAGLNIDNHMEKIKDEVRGVVDNSRV